MLIEMWHSSVQERSYFLTPWKWSFLSVTRVSLSRPYIVTSGVFPGVAWSLLPIVPSLSGSVCSVARYGDGLLYKTCARTAGSPRFWVAVSCSCCQLGCLWLSLEMKRVGLPHEFSPPFKSLKNRKQGGKKSYFCKNALFTREIISAYFFGWFQERLSCLLQTVKDLLVNNVFSRSHFCQEIWKMQVRTHKERLLSQAI